MRHTNADVEKLAFALNRFGNYLNKDSLWREQKAAYKSLASLTSADFVAELNAENDNWRRNMKLRYKLSEHWNDLVRQDNLNDALAVTRWIVKDWGSIKNIKDSTIKAHFLDAVYQKHFLLFEHISSKSKALALTNPDKLQIYDARVAVSLNVMQLAAETEVRLYFEIPSTQIRSIQHNEDCFQASVRHPTEGSRITPLPDVISVRLTEHQVQMPGTFRLIQNTRVPQAAFAEFDFVPVTLEDIYSVYLRYETANCCHN